MMTGAAQHSVLRETRRRRAAGMSLTTRGEGSRRSRFGPHAAMNGGEAISAGKMHVGHSVMSTRFISSARTATAAAPRRTALS